MSHLLQRKNDNDNAPMYGEENHLEIIAPTIELDNAIPLIGEKIPHGANVTRSANQYEDSDIDYSTMPPMVGFTDSPHYSIKDEPQPPVLRFINNPKDAYQRNDDGSVVITDVDGTTLDFSCGDYLAINATAPNFLINDILETDSHGILGGASMAFKTFADLRIVYSICTGADFMGHSVYKTGKVLYVCGEGEGALARRLKALQIAESDFNGNLLVLKSNISIDNKVDMDRLKFAIMIIKPALVVFDTFASLVSETDENAPYQVAKALRLIKETCRNGYTSSLIVHHYGKDATKGMRGASNFINDMDFAIEMTRATDSMITTMSCKKMKDGENFQDIHMEAIVVELGLTRQDGKVTTSLVLKMADYVPSENKSKGKPLDPTSQNILSAIFTAIEKHGETPPQSIVQKFKDSPQQLPQQVVHIDHLREFAYPYLNCAENSKRTMLKRHLDKLEKNYKSMYYDGYLWLILVAQQRNATQQ